MTPAKQQVATVRDTDTSAKELFVYHNAGKGGQSADPKLILRDIDGNGHLNGEGNGGTDAAKWSGASSSTSTHRYYSTYDADGDEARMMSTAGMTIERYEYNLKEPTARSAQNGHSR